MKLKDKVVLITGASRGIGAATALLFAQEGAKVALNYHISEYEPIALQNVKAIEQQIKQSGGEAIIIEADISKAAEVESLVRSTVDAFGTVDILVNNAGIVYDLSIDERTEDQWQTTIDTNLKGVYLVSKQISKIMKGKKGTKIINISSTSGIDALNPESIDYDATKAGIITLTKNFAQILAPHTNVNAVAPGWVNTEMNQDLPTDFVQKETSKIYLGRFAEPNEIAKINLFLASDDAGYLNGAVIIADGGRGH